MEACNETEADVDLPTLTRVAHPLKRVGTGVLSRWEQVVFDETSSECDWKCFKSKFKIKSSRQEEKDTSL